MNADIQIFESYPEFKEHVFCVVNAYMDTPKSRLTRHIRTGLGINKFYRDELKHIFRVDDNIFMRALKDLEAEGRIYRQDVVFENSPDASWHVSKNKG